MAKLPNIIEKERSTWKIISFAFLASMKGSKTPSLVRYGADALMSVFMFLEFGALGIIINEFTQSGVANARMEVILGAFALIIISTLIPSALSALKNYYHTVQSNDMQRYLQSLVFSQMRKLDIGTIEQPEFQNLLDVANSRGWSAVFNIISIITGSIRNMVALIIAAVSLVILSPVLLMIIVISVIPTYVLERKSAARSAALWKQSSEMRRMWQSKSSPIYTKSSLTELKNFGLVGIFLKKWMSLISTFHKDSQKLEKKNAYNEFIAVFLITAGYGVGFFMIINKVYMGALMVGSLVYTFAVISRFQSALQALFENFGRLAEHKKNLDTFIDLLEMEPLIKSGTRMIEPDAFESLEVRNVSFAYPGSDKKVTEHLSLTINRGDNIAIVGLNGAGKTTFIKLITRVYDPTEGEILVNGVNLKEYDLESWKQCMSILFQDYATYSEESIAENIMLGDITKHDQELVEKSAKESTAHDYIMDLNERYDQRVGTEFRGGVELSKGQKQKLVLARVFYREAPIVILDEPTAAIDALSEDAIFKVLQKNHTNQTRIIISHKFSNVRESDKIILIEHGKVIESGNHEELMQQTQGRYRQLFELQAEGYK